MWLTAPPSEPRDRPLPVRTEPAGPLRVTILGTSLTALYDWPTAVQEALAACPGPVVVSTVARPGATSSWGLAQTGAVLATDPDIVLIEFAANDADIRDGLWPWTSRDHLRRMVRDLRRGGQNPGLALMTMNPARGVRGLLRPTQGLQARMYHGLAVSEGLGLIDLYPRWSALPAADRGLQADGLHPDPTVAQQIIVPAVAAWLAAELPSGCPHQTF